MHSFKCEALYIQVIDISDQIFYYYFWRSLKPKSAINVGCPLMGQKRVPRILVYGARVWWYGKCERTIEIGFFEMKCGYVISRSQLPSVHLKVANIRKQRVRYCLRMMLRIIISRLLCNRNNTLKTISILKTILTTDHAWNNVQMHCTKMHSFLLYGKRYIIRYLFLKE